MTTPVGGANSSCLPSQRCDPAEIGLSNVATLGVGKPLSLTGVAHPELAKGVQLQYFGEKGAVGLVKPDGSVLVLSVGHTKPPLANVVAAILVKSNTIPAQQAWFKRCQATQESRVEILQGANSSSVKASFPLNDTLGSRVKVGRVSTGTTVSTSVSASVPVGKLGNGQVSIDIGLKETKSRSASRGDLTGEVSSNWPIAKYSNGSLVGGVAIGHSTVPYAAGKLGFSGKGGKASLTVSTIASQRLILDAGIDINNNLSAIGQITLADDPRLNKFMAGVEIRF
jgi:hypothetical protein